MYVGQHRNRIWGSLIVGACVVATGCSGGGGNDAGTNTDGGTSTDGGTNPLSCELNAGEFDGGVEMTGSLQPASAFDAGFTSTAPNIADTIEVTMSGETLGENGLPFVPVNPGDPQFVDGWNVKFDKYIVVVGHVRLSPQALLCSPTAISPLITPPVATKDGPFAVDVHQLDVNAPGDFVGADGMEPAGALFTFLKQDNGQPFDTGTLYAFTYDTMPATYSATNVNLPAADMPIYDEMVKHGWDKYIEAEAEYVGYGADTTKNGGATPQTGTMPYSSSSDSDGGYFVQTQEFAKMPQHVHFAMGWHDATTSVNCINTANGNFSGDNEANRGVQPNSAEAVIAQITIHTDHFFWDKLKQEGTPLRMDPLAAWMPEWDGGTNAPFDLSLLAKAPLATTFPDCTPLPDRAPFQNVPGSGGFTSDQANADQVVLNLNGVPASDIPGISNFMAFSVQSQTHLNANGLCYIIGQNSADPFYAPDVVPLDGGTPLSCTPHQ